MNQKSVYFFISVAPDSSQMKTALSLVEAMSSAEHKCIKGVFFYGEAVTIADKTRHRDANHYCPTSQLEKMALSAPYPIQICVTAALKRGVYDLESRPEAESSNVLDGVELSGLAEFAMNIAQTDKVISFT